jgi:DNA replication initiation complex subunit (GINS family)
LKVEDETIEVLKQLLDAEEQSEQLTKLPTDTYTRIATYVQKLRKGSDTAADDPRSWRGWAGSSSITG